MNRVMNQASISNFSTLKISGATVFCVLMRFSR